jgi:hypothetical protein
LVQLFEQNLFELDEAWLLIRFRVELCDEIEEPLAVVSQHIRHRLTSFRLALDEDRKQQEGLVLQSLYGAFELRHGLH